jgi:hypothetical protein
VGTLTREKRNNVKMLNRIRKELSKELSMMTPAQRQEFFQGAEDVYEGLKKMARSRETIAR